MIDLDFEDEIFDVYEFDEGVCVVLNNYLICIICMDDELIEFVWMKLCKYEFCCECIMEFLLQKFVCFVCNMVYGEMYGDQFVDGVVKIYKDEDFFFGYICGMFIIYYEFLDGC